MLHLQSCLTGLEPPHTVKTFSFYVKKLLLFLLWYASTRGVGGGGGGGKRRGLGPRNNVLTTCKAVTLSDGQWIIAVFFPQCAFDHIHMYFVQYKC